MMAAKLPSELVVEILTEIAWKLPDNPLYIENDLAQEDKDQLAVCSLVCRYWAKRCRPHLLSHLTIRSSDELDQLHHCLNAASPIRDVPSFSRCMRFLTMVHTGEWAVPWYHNIFGMIVQHDIILNRWKAGTVLELRSAFTGPGCSLEATNGYAPHSFSVGLPRTIPTSMLMIQRLVLSDMRFCAVSHMLRLAFNITQLKELACIRTTFTEELIDLAALPPVTRVGHQQHYAPEVAAIEACGTNDFEVHLMLAIMSSSGTVSRNARVARQVARSRAVAAMHKIVLALRPALQNGRKFEQRFGSYNPFRFFDASGVVTHTLAIWMPLHESSEPDDRGGRLETLFVTSVELYFQDALSVDDAKSFEWQILEDTVLGLSDSQVLGRKKVTVKIEITAQNKPVFTWLLDAMAQSVVLGKLKTMGRLEVRYEEMKNHRKTVDISLRDVVGLDAEHVVDGKKLVLDLPQRFELLLRKDEEKEALLRSYLETQAP